MDIKKELTGASGEQLENFRNGLILQRGVFKGLKLWSEHCRKICASLESSKSLRNNQLKGELAEVVLEQYLVEIQRILKLAGIDSLIIKNLGLLHRSDGNDKLYSSEIDICFVTPFRVYLFEVKSYKGDKTLTKECYLKGVSKIDIYAQSKIHLDFFKKIFDPYRIKYTLGREGLCPPYKLMFFHFSSNDSIKDFREDVWRKSIVYLNTNTILKWFSSEVDLTAKPQWDLKSVNGRLEQLNANRDTILKYHIARLTDHSKGL